MVRSLVAGARCTDSLARHRAGRLPALPAQESEGRRQSWALDSRREDSLLANVAIDEQAVVGQLRIDGVRPAHGDARRFQPGLEVSVQQQRRHRRSRVRAKGTLRFASDAVFAVAPDVAALPRSSSLLDKRQ